jgi:adenylate cyclase
MDERDELIRRLHRAGHDGDTRNWGDEHLASAAVDASLGGPGKHTLTALAREAGVNTKTARAAMQALGRPNPSRGERLYTDEDVELVRAHKALVDSGLPQDDMMAAGRILSQGMAQTAEAIRQVVGNALLEPGVSVVGLARRYLGTVDAMGPVVERMLAIELRAQLRDSLRNEFVTEAERRAGELADTEHVAVAFADLVDYTRIGETLPPATLGAIAVKLSELATGVVERPVKMIKTVGDAAMFVSPEVDPLMRTTEKLVATVDAMGSEFPQIRVGIAYGAATPQAGDWFGTPVNLASRVTAAAKPGRILVTGDVVEHANGFAWKRRRKRGLAGISERVRLFELAPTGE